MLHLFPRLTETPADDKAMTVEDCASCVVDATDRRLRKAFFPWTSTVARYVHTRQHLRYFCKHARPIRIRYFLAHIYFALDISTFSHSYLRPLVPDVIDKKIHAKARL